MPTLQRAVKKVLKALIAGKDVLVHCIDGTRHAGAFLCFVLSLLGDCKLQDIFDSYYTPARKLDQIKSVGKAIV